MNWSADQQFSASAPNGLKDRLRSLLKKHSQRYAFGPKTTMRAVISSVVIGLLISAVPSAYAQMFDGFVDDILRPQLGTLWVKMNPTSAEGNLRSCEMSYSVLAQDFEYKEGAFISLVGSFRLFDLGDDQLALRLELALQDIDRETGNRTLAAPANVFVVDGFETTKAAQLSLDRGILPGSTSAVFSVDETFDVILTALRNQEITIAFERELSQTALPFTVDLTVVETAVDGTRIRSPEAAREFLECTQALAGNAVN